MRATVRNGGMLKNIGKSSHLSRTDVWLAHPKAQAGESETMAMPNARTSSRRLRRTGPRSGQLPCWDEVVVGGDDLPTPISPYPGIREPVAAIERSLGPMAADHQPSRDDGRRAEAMDLHILVVRPLDRVWSRNDIAQHIVATDRPIAFAVNESVCQQPPKQSGITARQPESPIVLKPKEHLRLGILHAGRRSVDGCGFCTRRRHRRAPGTRVRSLHGQQQDDE